MTRPSKQEALDHLREAFPKGSTVYTILRHVSKSGMLRHISPVALTPDGPRYWWMYVATALDLPTVNGMHDAVKVRGAGMDMGFHLAYNLSYVLYGDGYALNHRWL